MKQSNLITFPELLSQCNCTDIDGITSFGVEIPSGSYIFEVADNLAATRLETGLKMTNTEYKKINASEMYKMFLIPAEAKFPAFWEIEAVNKTIPNPYVYLEDVPNSFPCLVPMRPVLPTRKNLLYFDPYIITDTKRMEDVLESADYEFQDAVAKGQPFLIYNFNRAEHDICEYLIKTAKSIGCPSFSWHTLGMRNVIVLFYINRFYGIKNDQVIIINN